MRDKKYKEYSSLNANSLVAVLKTEGFDGILIDAKGYYPYPEELLKLSKILGAPYISPDNVWVYYKL